MLTVQLKGGLANQLWQVAAGETIAAQTGRTLVFPTRTSAPNPHSPTNYFTTVLAPWAGGEELGPAVGVWEGSFHYVDWSALRAIPTSVVLDGYFQNWRYIPEDFSARLALPPTPAVGATTAFLHVRGGDYVSHWLHDVGLNKGSSYYARAASLFAEDTEFLVFTNDRAYAERAPWLAALGTRVRWAPAAWTEEECLAAMAACPRGGICPNSTFAWWGAWLGRGEGRVHVLPTTWFNDPGIYTEGYFFPGAVVLPV